MQLKICTNHLMSFLPKPFSYCIFAKSPIGVSSDLYKPHRKDLWHLFQPLS